jgi:hypothetical protein
MNTTAYTLLAAAALIASVVLALAGAGQADDQLAIAMLGLAGTLAGRGRTPGE